MTVVLRASRFSPHKEDLAGNRRKVSGGGRDCRERACRVASRDGALTLVSFAVGVSPPSGPALYGRSTELRPPRESDGDVQRAEGGAHASPSGVRYLDARSRAHTQSGRLDASPSNLGIGLPPPPSPLGAPWPARTSVGQRAPSSGNKDLKAQEGPMTWAIKSL